MYNVGKTWTINLKTKKHEEKIPNGSLMDRILHNNTGLNLCLSIYIKSLVSVFIYSLFMLSWLFLLNKAEEIFLRFFCQKKKKKKNIRVRIKPTFVWNFETYLQIQTLILIGYSSSTTLRQIPAFSLKNTLSWGPQPSCKPRKKWHVLRKIKERLFLNLPHPLPPGQDLFEQFPTPEPEKLDLSRGGGGMITGQLNHALEFLISL